MSDTIRTAIITGASGGIGAEIAKRLAADGLAVVLNYAGNAAKAEATASQIIKDGGKAIIQQADVASPSSVASLFDAAEQAFGGVDVVVSNAGVLKLSTIALCTDDVFDDTMATNLKGTFNICREAARRVRDGGRIINISSSAIGMRLPTYAIYNASKAAVEALTQVLAQEMRGRSITVNAVAPGPVATEMFTTGKSPELIAKFGTMNPLERIAEPVDIARVVAFLAGPEGAWVNGQILRANGGAC